MATHQSLPAVPPTATRHVHGVCPLDCPDTCSWVVTVDDGRAVTLQANRDHPYTRGALCEKVTTTRTSRTIASALRSGSERRLRRRNPVFRGGSERASTAPSE